MSHHDLMLGFTYASRPRADGRFLEPHELSDQKLRWRLGQIQRFALDLLLSSGAVREEANRDPLVRSVLEEAAALGTDETRRIYEETHRFVESGEYEELLREVESGEYEESRS